MLTENRTCRLVLRGGGSIDLLNPDPNDIDLLYIADSLSKVSRGVGNFERIFSVAEHSCLVAWRIAEMGGDVACVATGLLHDAPEAYLGDVPGPLKQFLPDYQAIEARMMEAIAARFGVEFCEHESIVKSVDKEMEHSEKLVIAGEITSCLSGIHFLSPEQASEQFLRIADKCGIA